MTASSIPKITAENAVDEHGRKLYRRTSGGNWARNFKPQRRERERMRQLVGDRDAWTCQICGTTDAPIWNLDHIVPYLHGGKYVESNLRLTCERCNTSRGARA